MFLARKKNEEVVLIVDIGSDTVGASLSSVGSSDSPKILYSFRSNITWHEAPEKGHLVSGITKTLNEVLKDVSHRGAHFIPKDFLGRHKISKSHIIFSAPWYVCETRIFRIEHHTPFVVTEDLVNNSLNKEVDRFLREAESKATTKIAESLEIVEKRIVGSKLNGYDTQNVFGKHAHSVEFSFYVSLVSKNILQATQRAIDSHFHIPNTEVSSFPLAAFTVFAASMPKMKDYLVVDVRGEVTDITSVCDGVLLSSVHFPEGKNSLIRSVSSDLQESFHSARSALKMVSHGHTAQKIQAGVFKVVDAFKTIWSDSYVKSVRNLLSNGSVPKTVFIIGDIEMEIYFEKIFKDMKNVAQVHSLKKADLKKYINVTPVFDDPFLELETIFVHQLSQ